MSAPPAWARVGTRVLYQPTHGGRKYRGRISAPPWLLGMFGDVDNGQWVVHLDQMEALYAAATNRPGATTVKAAALSHCEPEEKQMLICANCSEYIDESTVCGACHRRAVEQAKEDGRVAALNVPELRDFVDGVILEAQHQRQRWGEAHDRSKSAEQWFWLVGFLAGKALRAHVDGDVEKALHHTISTAAALSQWHAAILGEMAEKFAQQIQVNGRGRDADLDPEANRE